MLGVSSASQMEFQHFTVGLVVIVGDMLGLADGLGDGAYVNYPFMNSIH